MRRCISRVSVSSRPTWSYRVLSRSTRTRSRRNERAIKQLDNTELLSLIQGSNKEAATGPDNEFKQTLPQDRDGHSQSPPLTLSPLAEPRLVAARARYREGKPPPSKERSPFQLKLEKNPYAQALSTSPRLCLLTGIRLPSYFMIPFGIAKHPKTGAPWHLPRLADPMSDTNASNPHPSPNFPPSPNPDSTSTKLTRTVNGTHFVASNNALTHVSSLTKQGYRKLLPFRWKEDPSLKVSEMVWREDMADFVLGMLRRSTTRDLKYLASQLAAYIAGCKNSTSIPTHNQVGAALWLGSKRDVSAQDSPFCGAVDADERGPPLYAMYEYKNQWIPYFNLVELLGRTHLEALREVCPAQFGGQLAVIKAKRPTVKLQLELWKITGFLKRPTRTERKQEKASS